MVGLEAGVVAVVDIEGGYAAAVGVEQVEYALKVWNAQYIVDAQRCGGLGGLHT